MPNAIIKMCGFQEMDGENETIELTTEGKLVFKERSVFITYKESEVTGMEGTNTAVRITGDKVVMTRQGFVNTQMIFEEGVTHFSHYETPHGYMNVEVFTSSLSKMVKESSVNISMQFQIKIDDMVVSNNNLEMNAHLIEIPEM